MKTADQIVKELYTERLPEEPRTLNEKIRWRMRYDRRPLLTLTTDKYRVTEYLSGKGYGDLLKNLYFVTDNPNDIPFDDLPERYVIKSNHSSGDIIIIDSGIDLVTKTRQGRKDIIAKCDHFLRNRYWNELNEWAYKGIKPVIIVEEFLTDENDSPPTDYKFICFNGKAKVIEVIAGRFNNVSDNFYDNKWNALNFTWSDWPGKKGWSATKNICKPSNFPEMLETAEALAQPFDFVRIDLYNISNKIYFGEFTHYPSAGIGEFDPESYNTILGGYWKLPDINEIGKSSILCRLKRACSILYHKYR
jgi:TupA-like ATPgrasp